MWKIPSKIFSEDAVVDVEEDVAATEAVDLFTLREKD